MLQAADLTIRLHAEDDVVIARTELAAGTLIQKENVRAAVRIPAGHKIAVRAVAKGAPVHRYHQIIGFATQPIAPGDHVHVHNVAMGDLDRKSTRLNSSHVEISYAVFCLKKKKEK